MDRYLIIKIFKLRSKSNDIRSRVIVVTHNTSKVQGGYRYDKIGYIQYKKNIKLCYINLYKLAYWLNRGVRLKTKVSWLAGILSYNFLLKKKEVYTKIN